MIPNELMSFVESQERVVKKIAKRASELHAERVQHVRECKCSKHVCSSDYVHSPCIEDLGTPGVCSTRGRRIDETMSDFVTPPGANPQNLSDSIKENLCIYRNLDETFMTTHGQDEYGWLYLGQISMNVGMLTLLCCRNTRWTIP